MVNPYGDGSAADRIFEVLDLPPMIDEKADAKVRKYVKERGYTYPIAIDNDFAIWRALSNNYWPALYLVDAQGRVRHHQFGEGGYDQSERVIQQMLAEAGASASGPGLVAVVARGAEAAKELDKGAGGTVEAEGKVGG